MVEHGNHPDLHRLAPSGASMSIPIGGRGERGVRDLVGELALLPVEGGARVAIIEAADRMPEDAQSALLKTLEEPPTGTTILLCADGEERLLPTIRSRCIRVRLGPLGIRDVEAVLTQRGVADPPTAARLARIVDGRPGHAIAYALAPGAARVRGEIARGLLDLLDARLTERLTGIRDLAGRAADLARDLEAGAARAAQAESMDGGPPGGSRDPAETRRKRSGGRSRAGAGDGDPARGEAPGTGDGPRSAADADPAAAEVSPADAPARVPAAERRRGALTLVAVWRAVLRDLAVSGSDAAASVRDMDLLEDLRAVSGRLSPAEAGRILRELDVAGERLEGNVSPELVLDVLALRWVAGARAA